MLDGLSIRLDSWDVAYGPEVVAEEEEEVPGDVLLDVEVPQDAWRPVEPLRPFLPSRLVFVDGVRRVEARLVVSTPEVPRAYGVLGSCAAGWVEASGGTARFGSHRVRRVLILTSGLTTSIPFVVRPDVVYEPVSTGDRDPEAPLRKLQEEMRLLEEAVARQRLQDDRTLVVVDGPLTFAGPSRGAAVGYIKRIHQFYLRDAGLRLLRELPAGSRTPLFVLRSPRRFARYSWFVRLTPPGPLDSPYAGLVRLEVQQDIGLDVARNLADGMAQTLPRFVQTRFVQRASADPRIPQNLSPVAALEGCLRRALGDLGLLRRYIRARIAQEVGHV